MVLEAFSTGAHSAAQHRSEHKLGRGFEISAFSFAAGASPVDPRFPFVEWVHQLPRQEGSDEILFMSGTQRPLLNTSAMFSPISPSFYCNWCYLKSYIGIREVSKLPLHLRVLQAAEDAPALVAEPRSSQPRQGVACRQVAPRQLEPQCSECTPSLRISLSCP